MGRVNIPILILNIIMFVAALVFIILGIVTVVGGCGMGYLSVMFGSGLLICPITCLITTLIGKSRWVFYTKDEPSGLE